MEQEKQGMDRKVFDDRRRVGTVKAAINMYGERIFEGGQKPHQNDLPEKSSSSSRARELHMAKREVAKLKEGRTAESMKSRAESELSNAKVAVKDPALRKEQSNLKVKAQMRKMETLRKSSKQEDKALDVGSDESNQYVEVMRELKYVKQELRKLQLDMASVLEEKKRAEKELEGSSSKLESNLGSVEALRKEIEKVNEEQVLVELARIEALKEYAGIEGRREKESREFSSYMEDSRKKIKDAIEQIESSKEIEYKLAITLSDVNVLQNELKLVKEMERKVQRNDSLKHTGGSFRSVAKLEGSTSMKSITEELEVAKKELASVREEGFQFMASMDIIRSELKHVTEETARVKKAEEKANLTTQNLNSKLLRAKSKLEAATAAGGKAKSIVSNLSLTLEQLKTEAEVAKKEKALIAEETANIKKEIQKTESEIDLTEERLQDAMQELEAVKSSEALTLEKLQKLTENTMRARASASHCGPSITISKFEYEYLTRHAVGAEEIADKKVAAAQAWIEALKASEKEMLMKIEIAQRDARKTRVEEEPAVYRSERSLSAKKVVEGELRNWRQESKEHSGTQNTPPTFQRKSLKGSRNLTPSRRAKLQNSTSPAVRRTPRSSPFTIKKRKKVIPNLGKFFSGKRIYKVV